MTIANGRIDDFVNGDDLEIERTITSIPNGVLIESAWFMVKRNYSDPDERAIISKVATHSNTAGQGWILDDGLGDGEATVRFYLTPADTELLYAYSEYPYSIKIKLDNGRLNTPELGTIVAYPWVKQGVV